MSIAIVNEKDAIIAGEMDNISFRKTSVKGQFGTFVPIFISTYVIVLSSIHVRADHAPISTQ
jgi:hypothetical protein